MENLYIKGEETNYYIPTVDFNYETGICTISGKSYLEDTTIFYLGLLEWLDQYFDEVDKPIEFNVRLSYYNTSSSRSILDIFDILKIYEDNGGTVKVNWYCREIDFEVIKEEVDDYMEESDLKINVIIFEE
ncbi:MAG: DUF1987 domain-containing protein [Bacteroidales bacterium]|nr:DUF1987 domain-containing protein [Bacteroidales bacterium]MBN2757317.1 DUF1987 domain-containing protein [Bacteroidales bacterium]